ncbi:hypothetical protein ACRRTK_007234 [Alexandromys fortis]
MTELLATLPLCEWCGIGLPSRVEHESSGWQLSQPFQSSLNIRPQRASHTAHWVSPCIVDISGPETLSPAANVILCTYWGPVRVAMVPALRS